MNAAPRDTLLEACKKFYKPDEVFQARDLLFEKVPETNSTIRRVKHRKVEDVLQGMYAILLALPTETNLTFLALNLNNLPCVEFKNIYGVSGICSQNKMQEAIGGMQSEQEALKEEIRLLRELLTDHVRSGDSNAESSSVEVTPADTIANSVGTEDAEPARATPAPGGRNASNTVDATGNRASSGADDGRRSRKETTVPGNRNSSGSSRAAATHGGAVTYAQSVRLTRANEALINDVQLVNVSDGNETEISPFNNDSSWTEVRRRKRKPVVTGKKQGTSLKAINRVKYTRIFVSRLLPDIEVDSVRTYVAGFLNDDCKVYKLKPKFPSYSSFVVSCDVKHENMLMCPDNWEEGILVRRFVGNLPSENNGD